MVKVWNWSVVQSFLCLLQNHSIWRLNHVVVEWSCLELSVLLSYKCTFWFILCWINGIMWPKHHIIVFCSWQSRFTRGLIQALECRVHDIKSIFHSIPYASTFSDILSCNVTFPVILFSFLSAQFLCNFLLNFLVISRQMTSKTGELSVRLYICLSV